MRLALRLARRAHGQTSPNPMVGAVLVWKGSIIGQGWHHRAGQPHAEIEALRDADAKGHAVAGATLYVTLEPCCTHGRTPPCTDAIIAARIRRVVAGATDPNPAHRGRGFEALQRAGISVTAGVLAGPAEHLNEAFNHWIVHHTPFVTVKAAMTLDGKIATASGESRWITGEKARAWAMKMRADSDAVLVGINTVLADNPSLTIRAARPAQRPPTDSHLRRVILDSKARTPLDARVVCDEYAHLTILVVTQPAPARRVRALSRKVDVWTAPSAGRIELPWLLQKLGRENVTRLLVEGGGEVNASFLMSGLAQRIDFFYAPKILGGRQALKAVGGAGASSLAEALALREIQWRRLGDDLLLTARVVFPPFFHGHPKP
jgi:diaminohydroxyphosphoribosylaminopyrimidine deaminase / 5-amino-6-(5-phosphoribosylamino)uracil reductase